MAKIRAIVNGVSYYTTTTAIKKMTSSDFTLQNTALFFVLDKMGKNLGMATTVKLYDNKMDRHIFQIQLSKV
jgi:hypothetical protein